MHPKHGPQEWYWRLFSLAVNKLGVILPTTGYRLWVYTRWGAMHFDLIFDRRNINYDN